MDGYALARSVEVEPEVTDGDDIPVVHVSQNGKIRTYVAAAEKILTNIEVNQRTVIFQGNGRAVTKTISCVEILKTKFEDLHQITTIGTQRVDDIWAAKPDLKEDVDNIRVTRQVPMIKILLSLDELDPSTLGYQPPAATSQ
eukprot:m.72925 g.72925  ORF g.72925 m.72925 type:complete len:142 (-) comp24495_c1_seq1:279-704(-)